MKQFIYLSLLLVVSASFLFMSCSTGNDETPLTTERIDIKVTEVVMESTETSKSITVDANCQWTATTNGAWTGLVVSPSNNTLTISTPVNDTRDDRRATVTISSQSEKVKKTLSVTQRSGEARLEVSPTSLSYSGEGEKKEFTIKTNSEWSIAGANDWCHLSAASGTGDATIAVTVDANQEESARPEHKLIVSVKNGSLQRTVTINQGGATTLNVVRSKEEVPATKSSITINVTGTATWRASSNATWAEVDETAQGTGAGSFVVTCDDNRTANVRTAVITLKWSRETTSPVTVTIEQAAGELPVVLINETASQVTRESAVVSGSCTSMFPVSRYGFCFTLSDQEDPSVTNDEWTIAHTGSPDGGQFSDTLSGLISGRTYRVRAFAESEVGIAYSKTVSVQTLGDAPNPGENPTPDFAPTK